MEEKVFLPTVRSLNVADDIAEYVADGGSKQSQDHNYDDSD